MEAIAAAARAAAALSNRAPKGGATMGENHLFTDVQ